jgi:hypothetical protein
MIRLNAVLVTFAVGATGLPGTVDASSIVATHPQPVSDVPEATRYPKSNIARVIREALGPIRRCYERELQADPELTGNLSVAFAFSAESKGKVTSAEVASSTMTGARAAAMTDCILDIFRKLQFPTPHKDAGVIRVTYPLHFKSEGDAPPPPQ